MAPPKSMVRLGFFAFLPAKSLVSRDPPKKPLIKRIATKRSPPFPTTHSFPPSPRRRRRHLQPRAKRMSESTRTALVGSTKGNQASCPVVAVGPSHFRGPRGTIGGRAQSDEWRHANTSTRPKQCSSFWSACGRQATPPRPSHEEILFGNGDRPPAPHFFCSNRFRIGRTLPRRRKVPSNMASHMSLPCARNHPSSCVPANRIMEGADRGPGMFYGSGGG